MPDTPRQLPPIIGITGRARSGKDTISQILRTHGFGAYPYAFAMPFKNMLKAIGVDLDDPEWEANKNTLVSIFNATPRKLLQTLGSDWGRNMIHPDIWVNLADIMFKRLGAGMVVADVRFENEAEWVLKNGGIIIRVTRNEADTPITHESEAGIPPELIFDTIENNGDLDELTAKVLTLMEGIHGREQK